MWLFYSHSRLLPVGYGVRLGLCNATINEARDGIKNRLISRYGPGNAYAKDRTAFLKTIQTPDYKVDRDKPKKKRK